MQRSCWMFMLGLMLNSHGGLQMSTLRIPGVLQRFSISYLFVATMGLAMSPAELSPPAGSVYIFYSYI